MCADCGGLKSRSPLRCWFKVHLPSQQLEEDQSLQNAQRKALLEERKKELLAQQKFSENEHLQILDTVGKQERVEFQQTLLQERHTFQKALLQEVSQDDVVVSQSLTLSLTHSLTCSE